MSEITRELVEEWAAKDLERHADYFAIHAIGFARHAVGLYERMGDLEAELRTDVLALALAGADLDTIYAALHSTMRALQIITGQRVMAPLPKEPT